MYNSLHWTSHFYKVPKKNSAMFNWSTCRLACPNLDTMPYLRHYALTSESRTKHRVCTFCRHATKKKPPCESWNDFKTDYLLTFVAKKILAQKLRYWLDRYMSEDWTGCTKLGHTTQSILLAYHICHLNTALTSTFLLIKGKVSNKFFSNTPKNAFT